MAVVHRVPLAQRSTHTRPDLRSSTRCQWQVSHPQCVVHNDDGRRMMLQVLTRPLSNPIRPCVCSKRLARKLRWLIWPFPASKCRQVGQGKRAADCKMISSTVSSPYRRSWVSCKRPILLVPCCGVAPELVRPTACACLARLHPPQTCWDWGYTYNCADGAWIAGTHNCTKCAPDSAFLDPKNKGEESRQGGAQSGMLTGTAG